MKYEFRKELFMASRDRLKVCAETQTLRSCLTDLLSKGRLHEINKKRKDSLSLGSGDTSDLLKSFTKSIPLNSDLLRLLQSAFDIDVRKEKDKGKGAKPKKKDKGKEQKQPFIPQRFPSFFNLVGSGSEAKPAAKIPLGGMRSVKFLTDAEDQYFDRSHEPGDLQVSLLGYKANESTGGDRQGEPTELSDLLNVSKSSPNEGRIRIALNPTQDMKVGDLVQVKAVLQGAGTEFEEAFWVRIVDKEKPPKTTKKEEEIRPESIGLPQYHLVYREPHEEHLTWEQFEERANSEMDFPTIMHPLIEGDKLEAIYVNMDSTVLKSHKGRIRSISEEQIELAEKKYVSSVYFHTLFLFTIARHRNYSVQQGDTEVDLADFLKDVFSTYYSEFLLNFGMEQLMATLDL